MDKRPNPYGRFLKDIHTERIDQFKRFIKFARTEFGKDLKGYTEKMPVYNSYRVARFYVDHPDFPKQGYRPRRRRRRPNG